MSKTSDGGKGSSSRPFTNKNTFDHNFESIFGESKLERKKREEALQKLGEEIELELHNGVHKNINSVQ
jgi:ribosomal 50S subunit-associated protein YjgA (DUF615 family)